MKVRKTVNWFRGNINGGGRQAADSRNGLSVEDLLRMKSESEMRAVRRHAGIGSSQAKDMCPIQRIHVFDLTEARKNELLARYGLGDESKRRDFQRKVTGR